MIQKKMGPELQLWEIGDPFSKTAIETEFPKSVHVEFPQKSKKLQNMIYILYEYIMQSGESAYKHVV